MQGQRHRQSAWNTRHMLYFLNLDDSFIPNMMIDTSPWSSCSRWSPVTLVTLIRSYNQFYRAECITVSGFFSVFFTLDLSGNSWKIERSKSSTKYIKTFVVRALASLRQNCHVLKQSLLFQCLSYILRRKLSFHQRLKKNKLSFVQLWTKGSYILFEALNTQC